MAVYGQVVRAKAAFQKDDKPNPELQVDKTRIPASWKLSKQQQEFIDLFTADDHKKQ